MLCLAVILSTHRLYARPHFLETRKTKGNSKLACSVSALAMFVSGVGLSFGPKEVIHVARASEARHPTGLAQALCLLANLSAIVARLMVQTETNPIRSTF
jgi:hypothetical protein